MPVICPKCERPIAALKQWHYCAKVDIDSLFVRKNDVVPQLFDALIQVVGEWPEVQFSGTKACIVFVANTTFLIVKPMKAALDIHFSLPMPEEEEVVYKCVAYNGKYVHYIRLRGPADLTPTVFRLIRKAYNL